MTGPAGRPADDSERRAADSDAGRRIRLSEPGRHGASLRALGPRRRPVGDSGSS